MVKALETEYAGCVFRSRIEARWAVFFDAVGLEWSYEPQGYELPSGWYLPDFWLPNGRGYKSPLWFEVKGPEPTEHEKRLIEELQSSTGVIGVIAHGDIPRLENPTPDSVKGYKNGAEGTGMFNSCNDCDAPRFEWFRETKTTWYEKHWNCGCGEYTRSTMHPRIQYGLREARSARFEHGMKISRFNPKIPMRRTSVDISETTNRPYLHPAKSPWERELSVEEIMDKTNVWSILMFAVERASMEELAEAKDYRFDKLYWCAADMRKWVACGWITADKVTETLLQSAERNGTLDQYGVTLIHEQIEDGLSGSVEG